VKIERITPELIEGEKDSPRDEIHYFV
jgi:hypothetical protein